MVSPIAVRHDAPRERRTAPEHAATVLALAEAVGTEEVALAEAGGRVSSQSISSLLDLPAWDNSAMDGYAVALVSGQEWDPTAQVPVLELPVTGVVAAGETARFALDPGSAARIMTGAPVPQGTLAVVPVEETDAGVTAVRISASVRAGSHIRRQGEDVRSGDEVVPAGAVLTPARLAVIAGTGHARVAVYRRPRVLVLSTGSELRAPGEALEHGQIYESNSHQLAALVREAGADAVVLHLPDDVAGVREALAQASAGVDLVVSTGGVSVGDFDVVRDALAGGDVAFVSVTMQPGKPQGAGRLADGTPIIALPGNPVSSFVSFEVFVRPVIRRLAGASNVTRRRVKARLEIEMTSPAAREQYARVTLSWPDGVPVATPVGGRGSHLMGALASADGLAVVPAEVTEVAAGTMVEVIDLREDAR